MSDWLSPLGDWSWDWDVAPYSTRMSRGRRNNLWRRMDRLMDEARREMQCLEADYYPPVYESSK